MKKSFKRTWKPTFSKSISRPRLVPRPVTGTEECRSSLPRIELKSEPAVFFLEADLGAARVLSISRFKSCFNE